MYIKREKKEEMKIILTLDLNTIKLNEEITLDDFITLLRKQRFEFLRYDPDENLLYVTTVLTVVDKLHLVYKKFKIRLLIELDNIISKLKRKTHIIFGKMTTGLKRKIKRNITKEKVRGLFRKLTTSVKLGTQKCKGKITKLFKKKEE